MIKTYRFLYLTWILVPLSLTAEVAPERITVLSSSETDSSTQIVSALQTNFRDIRVQARTVSDTGAESAMTDQEIVIALGSSAAQKAVETSRGAGVVAVLSTKESCLTVKKNAKKDFDITQLTCIVTTPPPLYALALSKEIFPVGVTALAFTTEQSAQNQQELRVASIRLGVTLRVVKYHDQRDFLDTLANAEHPTVLIATPDPVIYNNNNIKAIMDVAYENNVGMIGYSPSLVSAGAVAGVFYSKQDALVKIFESIDQLRRTHHVQKFLEYPELSVRINNSVADSLNIVINSSSELKSALDSIRLDE